MEKFGLCEICSKRIETNRGTVNCAICDRVQHCSCAGLLESHLTKIAAFHCFLCESLHGETEYRGKINRHRRNFLEDAADEKPVQTCTPKFIEGLKYLQFPRVDGGLKILAAHKLTLPYLQDHGFNVPILVKDKDGLDMKLPPNTFDITSICELVGKDFVVDVVDVAQQSNFQLRCQDFLSYFFSKHRKFPICIPSLDFSNTRLEDFVQSPSIARELDWVEKYWPKDSSLIKPCLQKYCSISMKGSYIDFHIAVGGTSVWYNIFEGEKTFYLIEPTENNLRAFQIWMSSSNKSETFFAKQVDDCYQLEVKKGETVFLPTGWIYGSLTLTDCLVFGGNFLHELNIPFQLRIHDIEHTSRGNTAFPTFELLNMYAGLKFVEEFQQFNKTKCKIQENKVCSIKALAERIKFWVHAKDHKIFRHMKKLKCQKLVKDLFKQVKQAERFHKAMKTAKPEIETVSTVPVAKDFIGSILKENEKTQKLKMTLKKVPTQVKLTLPKPSTYPYRNNKIVHDDCAKISQLPEENVSLIDHPWSIADASHSNGDLKIKLRIGRQSPDVLKISNTAQNTHDSVLQSRFKSNINSSEDNKKMPLEIKQDNSSQLPGQNQVSKLVPTFSGTKNNTCDNTESNSDDSSSDIEVVFVGKSTHNRQKKHVDDSLSGTSGNHEGDITSPGVNTLLPHSSSNSTLDMTSLSAGILSPLTNTLRSEPEIQTLSATLQTNTAISEILSSSSTNETEILSSLATAAVLHPWKTAFEKRRITGLAQIDYSLTAEPKPTTSQKTRGPVRSSISLTTESEGVLSICNRTRQNRKKKALSRHLNKTNVNILEDGHTEMGRVHEDDSFVYLSLETSDEEEEPVRKFRGKQYIDETWCPGARLGPLLPRVEKPVRDVKRNQAIEKGLEAAAAKKAGLPPPKRPYHIRKKRVPRPVAAPDAVTIASSSPTSGVTSSSPIIPSKRKAKKMTKPKRGMATAKQRLGKILKMNKMTF